MEIIQKGIHPSTLREDKGSYGAELHSRGAYPVLLPATGPYTNDHTKRTH